MRYALAFTNYHRWLAVIGVIFQSLVVVTCLSEEPPNEPVVAATVNDAPILVSEVERELRIALGDREITPAARPYYQAKALAQLIDRHLILQWLRSTGNGASDTEIDLEITRLEKRLQPREVTLGDYLDSQNMTPIELRNRFEWQIGWSKFLGKYLTDDNLEKYFNEHRRDFDGTRMEVAHLLLKIDGDTPADVERTRENAAKIRSAIVSGDSSFEDAARRHSAAPTNDRGGAIGFIERHQPMHESFSRAAFALNKGEISRPVETPFGIHLIRCINIEPGQRTWQDARDELTTAVTLYLFNWAASKERVQAQITFTNAVPHFVPGSEELSDYSGK